MTEQPELPSAADLDAVNAELEKAATGDQVQRQLTPKEVHDKQMAEMSAKTSAPPSEPPPVEQPPAELPELTPGPETDEALAYVEGMGYSKEAAERIVRSIGVDDLLDKKRNGPPTEQSPKTADTPLVSRHGEVFNPDVHARLPTGDPATDSSGKFIAKKDHYAPRTSAQFPDSGPAK